MRKPLALSSNATSTGTTGTAAFESLDPDDVSAFGMGFTSTDNYPANAPPGVAPGRMTGHTGETYTYGQKRGPAPKTTAALQIGRENMPDPNVEMVDDDGDEDADSLRGKSKFGAASNVDDDDMDAESAHEEIVKAGHAGQPSTAQTAMDDDETDPLEEFEAAMKSSEGAEEIEVLPQPPIVDPPVTARMPAGQSRGKIADVKVTGSV